MKALQNFDLNLLVFFNALMIERSVSKAADKVHLSQSAMSHALNRLRDLLDDPIMVKTNKGMLPTSKAFAMEMPIREALIKIQQHIYAQEEFKPSSAHANFIVYGPEYFETAYLPALFAYLQKKAPNVKIMTGVLRSIEEDALTNGEVDYFIGIDGIHTVPKRLRCRPWLRDALTCVVSNKNEAIGDHISIEAFRRAKHIYHSTLGTPFTKTILDKWLKQNKIKRQIAVDVPGYLSAMMITETTDFVLTLPLLLAKKLIQKMDLRIVRPPDGFPKYKLNLIWHPLYENEPDKEWFRRILFDLAAGQLD
jgi:DNA-binding transcriptional LysR family regulator